MERSVLCVWIATQMPFFRTFWWSAWMYISIKAQRDMNAFSKACPWLGKAENRLLQLNDRQKSMRNDLDLNLSEKKVGQKSYLNKGEKKTPTSFPHGKGSKMKSSRNRRKSLFQRSGWKKCGGRCISFLVTMASCCTGPMVRDIMDNVENLMSQNSNGWKVKIYSGVGIWKQETIG